MKHPYIKEEDIKWLIDYYGKNEGREFYLKILYHILSKNETRRVRKYHYKKYKNIIKNEYGIKIERGYNPIKCSTEGVLATSDISLFVDSVIERDNEREIYLIYTLLMYLKHEYKLKYKIKIFLDFLVKTGNISNRNPYVKEYKEALSKLEEIENEIKKEKDEEDEDDFDEYEYFKKVISEF